MLLIRTLLLFLFYIFMCMYEVALFTSAHRVPTHGRDNKLPVNGSNSLHNFHVSFPHSNLLHSSTKPGRFQRDLDDELNDLLQDVGSDTNEQPIIKEADINHSEDLTIPDEESTVVTEISAEEMSTESLDSPIEDARNSNSTNHTISNFTHNINISVIHNVTDTNDNRINKLQLNNSVVFKNDTKLTTVSIKTKITTVTTEQEIEENSDGVENENAIDDNEEDDTETDNKKLSSVTKTKHIETSSLESPNNDVTVASIDKTLNHEEKNDSNVLDNSPVTDGDIPETNENEEEALDETINSHESKVTPGFVGVYIMDHINESISENENATLLNSTSLNTEHEGMNEETTEGGSTDGVITESIMEINQNNTVLKKDTDKHVADTEVDGEDVDDSDDDEGESTTNKISTKLHVGTSKLAEINHTTPVIKNATFISTQPYKDITNIENTTNATQKLSITTKLSPYLLNATQTTIQSIKYSVPNSTKRSMPTRKMYGMEAPSEGEVELVSKVTIKKTSPRPITKRPTPRRLPVKVTLKKTGKVAPTLKPLPKKAAAPKRIVTTKKYVTAKRGLTPKKNMVTVKYKGPVTAKKYLATVKYKGAVTPKKILATVKYKGTTKKGITVKKLVTVKKLQTIKKLTTKKYVTVKKNMVQKVNVLRTTPSKKVTMKQQQATTKNLTAAAISTTHKLTTVLPTSATNHGQTSSTKTAVTIAATTKIIVPPTTKATPPTTSSTKTTPKLLILTQKPTLAMPTTTMARQFFPPLLPILPFLGAKGVKTTVTPPTTLKWTLPPLNFPRLLLLTPALPKYTLPTLPTLRQFPPLTLRPLVPNVVITSATTVTHTSTSTSSTTVTTTQTTTEYTEAVDVTEDLDKLFAEAEAEHNTSTSSVTLNVDLALSGLLNGFALGIGPSSSTEEPYDAASPMLSE